MTLKEKFENILCNWIDKDYNRKHVAEVIELDVDYYAIEFAEWVIDTDNKPAGQFTIKELLEIFKK